MGFEPLTPYCQSVFNYGVFLTFLCVYHFRHRISKTCCFWCLTTSISYYGLSPTGNIGIEPISLDSKSSVLTDVLIPYKIIYTNDYNREGGIRTHADSVASADQTHRYS